MTNLKDLSNEELRHQAEDFLKDKSEVGFLLITVLIIILFILITL